MLKLNLCSGSNPMEEGFVNVDVVPGPKVDQVVDLNVLPWPWADGSVDVVASNNGLEHLAPLGIGMGQRNIIAILKEIHRVLRPGGKVAICVPATDGRGAFQDPTHVTYWNQNTFLYFIKESNLCTDFHYEMPDAPVFSIDPEGEDKFGVWTTEEEEQIWVLAKLRKP